MAAVTGERWSLDAHAPEADSLEKTARPAVKNGGSILRPEWKRFESRTRLNLNPLNGAQMRAWKTTFGGRTAKPGARNGADGCWKLALHLSPDITWWRPAEYDVRAIYPGGRATLTLRGAKTNSKYASGIADCILPQGNS